MLTLFSLLSETSSGVVGGGSKGMMWLVLGIFVVLLIVMMISSSRANKKRQKEAEEKLNNMRVGDRVKTIGGICGIIVEINDDENTFVIRTGLNDEGNYIKFDKIAVYQTSHPEDEKTEEATTEVAEEVTEAVEEVTEAVEEQIVEVEEAVEADETNEETTAE